MKNKAFMFDLDGTILFLSADWNKVKTRLVEMYRTYGIKIDHGDITNIFRNINETENKLDSDDSKKDFREKAFDIIRSEEIKGASNSYYREGADLLLDYLKEETLALISSNSRVAADIAFRVTGIDSTIFKSIIMRDDVDKLKPHPQGIIKAVMQLGEYDSNLKNFYYIGDQKNDVIAAKEASKELSSDNIVIKTVAVSGGASKEEKIKAQNPDYFARSMLEVKNVVKGILSE